MKEVPIRFFDITESHPNAFLRSTASYKPPQSYHFILRPWNILTDPPNALTTASECPMEVNNAKLKYLCQQPWAQTRTFMATVRCAPRGPAPRTPPPAPASPVPPAIPAQPFVAQRHDDIVKSHIDKRSYRGLVLSNGMKVLLVSDSATDKAAAALDVNVGYLSDPDDLPGLAHFCEHMLFLGTKKYPEENEYNKFLNEHGGSCNASTSSDHTTYYFDVLPAHLPRALDIFAQFFISPLFTETATERELNAVNSEHEKNTSSDVWRLDQLNKSTASPDHPYHKFGTGNRETLQVSPKQRGVDVRQELLLFHRTWYSANIMTLIVLGKGKQIDISSTNKNKVEILFCLHKEAAESLDELESLVAPLFSLVENRGVTAPSWPDHPYPPELCRKRAYCVPVKDVRSLSINFPTPDERKHYKSGPTHYVSHLLGHEGAGSLLAALKARGWCNNLVGGTRTGARGFSFFGVQMDLTEDGVEHVDDIIKLMFQYINMVKDEGPQRWIWEESRDLMAMEFRFKDTQEPRSFVAGYVHSLQEFPMEDVLSAYYLLSEWRPELVERLLERLTPEHVRVGIVAKVFEGKCTETEPWYGTKYLQEDIEPDKIQDWQNAGRCDDLHLPLPNEFIPTKMELEQVEDPAATAGLMPSIIKDSPLMRAWFKQDNEFQLPKAFVTFDFVSPLAYSEPATCGLTAVWVLMLRDSLQQFAYAAELAGLAWIVDNAKSGISITIEGYDDKQHVLLDKIVEKIVHFKADPARFEIMKENHVRAIKNFEAEQPYQHAAYQQALCLSELVWTKGQLLDAAQRMTVEQLEEFARALVRRVHVEGLLYGNFTKERALNMAEMIENKLPKDAVPLLPQQLMLYREVELNEGVSFLREVENGVHKSSCAALYYQCGLRDSLANVVLELLAQVISEPCFNVLRTKVGAPLTSRPPTGEWRSCIGFRVKALE
ncbi:Insulin-degrading enzyme [Eumeta japonica]|uniref:Insulin-degrading enzyme n=1 Tax=Eumeta variegata TaxID=151549 RepID=A0A4C1Y4H2_EUMVA|nr:Insulin-degrading enzyme [Eumeta japonica]